MISTLSGRIRLRVSQVGKSPLRHQCETLRPSGTGAESQVRIPPVSLVCQGLRTSRSQRWHFDLWPAPEEAEARIEAAVAVGGSVIDDSEAPSVTVLAERDGNKGCVCTDLGRS